MFLVRDRAPRPPAHAGNNAHPSMVALQLTMALLFHAVLWPLYPSSAVGAIGNLAFSPYDEASQEDASTRVTKWVLSKARRSRRWLKESRVPMVVLGVALDVGFRVLAPDASPTDSSFVAALAGRRRVRVPPRFLAFVDEKLDRKQVLFVFKLATKNGLRWKHDCSELPTCKHCTYGLKVAPALAVHAVRHNWKATSIEVASLFDLLKMLVADDAATALDEASVAIAAAALKMAVFDAYTAHRFLVCGGFPLRVNGGSHSRER